MRIDWKNILLLGVKELRSLARDPVMMFMVFFSFSFDIYIMGTSISLELHNTAIAVVDEDKSPLSRRIAGSFLPPYFNAAKMIDFRDIDKGLDNDVYTFVVTIPEKFEENVLKGNVPEVQVNIDATSVMIAGIGAGYIENIILNETLDYMGRGVSSLSMPVTLETRYAFNSNLKYSWFSGIMEIINNVSMFAILLTGAALIREREHGTIEHLLVMPVTPIEIMLSKVWSSGVVVLCATAFSLWGVVEHVLMVPLAGSVVLFLTGTLVYLFFASALGIFLGTVARSMPQFGLLFILTILPMLLLSGGQTPMESQPQWLQTIMGFVPSSHFVSFAQAILYRGAGLEIVWPDFLMVGGVGLALLILSALFFRRSIAKAGG